MYPCNNLNSKHYFSAMIIQQVICCQSAGMLWYVHTVLPFVVEHIQFCGIRCYTNESLKSCPKCLVLSGDARSRGIQVLLKKSVFIARANRAHSLDTENSPTALLCQFLLSRLIRYGACTGHEATVCLFPPPPPLRFWGSTRFADALAKVKHLIQDNAQDSLCGGVQMTSLWGCLWTTFS